MGLEPFTPGRWEVDRSAYYSDRTCVNHSSLKVFRKSRRLYFQQFVTGQIEADAPTSFQRLGTWTHCSVLEPETWERVRQVAPEGVTRRHKKFSELEGEAQAVGRELLTQDDAAKVEAMTAAVLEEPWVADCLSHPGEAELPVRWLDPATGIACKALLDWVSGGVIFDLKTASEPYLPAWAWQALDLGYDRQAAFYKAGAEHGLGLSDVLFVHIVVGSEPPFDVLLFEMHAQDLQIGATENAADLAALAYCRETGNWDSLGRGKVIHDFLLPRRAMAKTTT